MGNFKNQIMDNKKQFDKQFSNEDDETKDDSSSAETCDFLMKLNQNAFKRLNAYAHNAMPLSTNNVNIKVHPLLTTLSQYLEVSHGKMEHGVVDACAQAAFKLSGGSIIFCKS